MTRMATIEVDRYDTDDLLRMRLLSDERLTLTEIAYPGSVRVHASGRYHARVDVYRTTYNFSIKELPDGERELVGTFHELDTLLNDYVWHRAAEAMLAHRRGHADAQLRKELRKPKQDD